jgi:hypothetical protein
MTKKTQPTLIGSYLKKYDQTIEQRQKYIKKEFQSYGLDLAKELGDWKNRSLYIRLAKTVDRQILEQARYFIKDQNPGTIETPYKLFMWKLRQLREKDKKS